MIRLLDDFSKMTGMCINRSKSAIYFSKWAQRSFKSAICRQFNIPQGKFPFTYLGNTISDGRVRIRHQLSIVDKTRNKLAGWKANTLSQTGRVVLVQSVLQAIPVHCFLSNHTATSVIRKLEALNRSFLWKHGPCPGMHLLKWDIVKLSKEEGGLGLKHLSLEL